MRHYQPGDDKGTGSGEQRLLPYWTFRHAANAGYAGTTMRLCQMCNTCPKTFEQQTAKQQYDGAELSEIICVALKRSASNVYRKILKMMQMCKTLARRLTNNIITTMTYRTDMKYHFSARNHKFNDNLLATHTHK